MKKSKFDEDVLHRVLMIESDGAAGVEGRSLPTTYRRRKILERLVETCCAIDTLGVKAGPAGMHVTSIQVRSLGSDGQGFLGRVTATRGSSDLVAFYRERGGLDCLTGMMYGLLRDKLDWRVDKPLKPTKPADEGDSSMEW